MNNIINTKKIKYKKKGIIIGSTIFLFLFAIVYFSFNPENSHYFPKCVFHSLTGFDCPGCGSQRAIHNLLHFELGEAFIQNPLFVCAIPYIILGIYFEYFGGKFKYPHTRKILFGQKATIYIFIITILFWIGRNAIKFI